MLDFEDTVVSKTKSAPHKIYIPRVMDGVEETDKWKQINLQMNEIILNCDESYGGMDQVL